jgi:ribosomal protein L7/L12
MSEIVPLIAKLIIYYSCDKRKEVIHMVWNLIKFGAGIYVANEIVEASRDYTRKAEKKMEYYSTEARLMEIGAAIELLEAMGYDKPRGVEPQKGQGI